jgi:hypothetical protein
MMKIKQPSSKGGNIIPPPILLFDRLTSFKHPVFCLKYVHKDYGVDLCDKNDKAALISQLAILGKLTWDEIQTAPRHGVGTEKIARNSIIPSIPREITKDVDTFLALRFSGRKAFIGFRTNFIFHVVYIDRNYTVYKH